MNTLNNIPENLINNGDQSGTKNNEKINYWMKVDKAVIVLYCVSTSTHTRTCMRGLTLTQTHNVYDTISQL